MISKIILKTINGIDRPAICSIIPNKKTSPKRIQLAMIFLFSGFAISIISSRKKNTIDNSSGLLIWPFFNLFL